MILGLSHLAEHKFRHNFQDCLNPIVISFFTVSITVVQKTCFEKINLIDFNISQQSDLSMAKNLLFGSEKLKDKKNSAILTSTIKFIQSTERFKYLLFQ